MTTRITAAPGADGTPENSLAGLVYALSLPVDAVMVEVCRRPGVPGYAPASLTDLFLPWESLRRTVSSLSDVVLYRGEESGNQRTGGHSAGKQPEPEGAAKRTEPEDTAEQTEPEDAAQADTRTGTDRKGNTVQPAEADRAGEADRKGNAVRAGEADRDAQAVRDTDEPVTLREVCRRMAPYQTVKLHCHLREPGLEEAVCILALEWSMAGRLILSGKLDLSLCGGSGLVPRVAELYISPEDQLSSFYRGYREIPGYDAQAARQLAELCARCGSTMAHIRQDVVTRRFITMLAERGVGVSAWTVDEAEDLRWFLSAGAADVCTRNIAPALALRG